ncbi:hypothetical protein ACLOJK_039406 [Asimina triloba]
MAPQRSCCINEKVDLIEFKRSISATHAQAMLAGRCCSWSPAQRFLALYECGTQQINEWHFCLSSHENPECEMGIVKTLGTNLRNLEIPGRIAQA